MITGAKSSIFVIEIVKSSGKRVAYLRNARESAAIYQVLPEPGKPNNAILFISSILKKLGCPWIGS